MIDVTTKKAPPRLQERRTPRWFFELLNARFGPFQLDAFAQRHNALCERYLSKREDGTRAPWVDKTFGNPPFAIIEDAVVHAIEEAEQGRRSVLLGPVGCSQEWFQHWAIRGTVYVPDHRISYDTPDGRPTDPRISDESGADRDTHVFAFGGEHYNPGWRRGVFRVRRLLTGC